MALAAILAAKAEVLLSIRIGSQHAGRVAQSWALFWIFRFIHFGFLFFFGCCHSSHNPLFIEIDKCVSVGDF